MNFKKLKQEMLTCVIYTRVSSKDQLEGYSLESQEKICRTFAEKNNLQVLKIFKEEGESAKNADRTELREMLKYVEKNKNKIGKLIIYKVDRLARKNEDYYALKVMFKKYGMAIQSATEPIESNPSGQLMEGVLSAMAEFDNNVRAQRTAEGMRTRLLKGLWGWGAPLGYINTKDVTGEKIIIQDPDRAPVIRMIFEEFAKGVFTFKGISKKVNGLNMKSKHGKKISPQLVVKILRNPIYCGRIECPKWEIAVEGKHEPIVSVGLFSKVQKMLNGENMKKNPRNRSNPDFPLRGIRCEGCGGNISGGWTVGRHKKYAYYGCIKEECPKRKAIAKEEFENDFTNFLATLTPDPPNFQILKEAIMFAHEAEMGSVLKENKRIDIEIEKIGDRKQKLLGIKLRELISDEEFKTENSRLTDGIKNLEISKTSQLDSSLNIENAIDFAFNLIQNLPSSWKNLEVDDLRVLRNALFPENLCYSYPGIKTADIPMIYKVNQESNGEKERLVAPRGIEPLFGG